MELSGHTVLITGGASGIGLGMAARFLHADSTVIVCGRDLRKLQDAEQAHPGLVTFQADLSTPADRSRLIEWVTKTYPRFDILVNNAGIQRRLGFLRDDSDWDERAAEIRINFDAPAHLVSLVQPHFMGLESAAIINITSNLAFRAAPFAPIYAATKAALHSLSLSLRAEYKGTAIEVINIIPSIVNTDLGGKGLHDHGVSVEEFSDFIMGRLRDGEVDITVQT